MPEDYELDDDMVGTDPDAVDHDDESEAAA